MAVERYGGAVVGVIAALCCAVVGLMLTSGGGAQSVLISLRGGRDFDGGRWDTESPLSQAARLLTQAQTKTTKQLSVMQLLSGEAVEPLLMRRREGGAAAARHMEPPGWRHAKVRSAALGEKADWVRRYDKASRRRTQERRSAVQEDEAEERMYRAHQTSHAPSFASIAAYMTPEGEAARSIYNSAISTFMAAERAREHGALSRPAPSYEPHVATGLSQVQSPVHSDDGLRLLNARDCILNASHDMSLCILGRVLSCMMHDDIISAVHVQWSCDRRTL
jgi:hypothetical protein